MLGPVFIVGEIFPAAPGIKPVYQPYLASSQFNGGNATFPNGAAGIEDTGDQYISAACAAERTAVFIRLTFVKLILEVADFRLNAPLPGFINTGIGPAEPFNFKFQEVYPGKRIKHGPMGVADD